jgi:hypothetical protein
MLKVGLWFECALYSAQKSRVEAFANAVYTGSVNGGARGENQVRDGPTQ